MERQEIYSFAPASTSAERGQRVVTSWELGRKHGFPLWTEFVAFFHYPANCFFEHRNPTQYAFEIPLQGAIRIVHRDRSRLLKPGEVYLLPSGEFNRLETTPTSFCSKWSVGICGSMAGGLLGELFREHLYFPLEDNTKIIEIITELQELLARKDEASAPRIGGLTMQFLLELAGNVPKRLPTQLTEAIRIFEFNIGKPLDLGRVADELNVTPSYLNALFKKHIGLTCRAYRQKIRIQQAELLLHDKLLPIKEIATRIGYSAPQHFTRDIRKSFGCSPREMRNQGGKTTDDTA